MPDDGTDRGDTGGEWRRRLELLEAGLGTAAGPDERAALLFRTGRLLELFGGDPAGALAAYQRASEERPGWLPPVRAARALFEDAGHGVMADRLRAVERAVEPGPDDAGVLSGPASDPAGAGRRRRRLVQSGDWAGLADQLRSEIGRTSEPAARAAIGHALARLLTTRLADPEGAYAALEDARRDDPANLLILDELEHLCLRTGRYERLAETIRERRELLSDPRMRAVLTFRLARVFEENLGQPELAAAEYRTLPDEERALTRLGRLHRAAGRYGELAAVLQREIELAADPDSRSRLMFRLGELLLDRLERTEEAAAWFWRSLEEAPRSSPAVMPLARLYHATDDWRGQIRLALYEAGQTDDPGRAALLTLKAAELWLERGDSPAEAEAVLARLLDREPGHLGALSLAARIAYRAGAWPRLIELNRREIGLTGSRARKAWLHLDCAEISFFRLNDRSGAIAELEAALALEPRLLPAVRLLSELYREEGRTGERAILFEREAEAEGDPLRKAGLLLRAGEVAAGMPDGAGQAIELVGRAARLAPGDPAVVERLLSLAFESGRSETLRETLREQLAACDDPLLALSLRLQLALMEPPDGACAALGRIVLEQPGCLPAAEQLVLLASELGRDEEAAGHLRRAAAETGSFRLWELLLGLDLPESERSELAHEAAGREQPADPESKLRLLRRLRALAAPGERSGWDRQILELDPDDRPARERLLRRAQAAGEWDESVALLLGLAELSRDPAEVRACRLEAMELLAFRLGREEEAARVAEEIDAAAPDPVASELLLDRLVRTGDWAALETRFGAASDWRGLVSVYQRALAGADLSELRLRGLLHARIGEVLLDRLGDLATAVRHLEQAAELLPDEAGTAGRLAAARTEQQRVRQQAEDDCRNRIEAAPFDPAGYHEMFGLAVRTGRSDRAWAAAAALVALGEALEPERLAAGRPGDVWPLPGAALTRDEIAGQLSPDRALTGFGQVLDALRPAVPALVELPAEDRLLRLSVTRDPLRAPFEAAARAFLLDRAEHARIFEEREGSRPLAVLPVLPPRLVIAPGLAERPAGVIRFLAGYAAMALHLGAEAATLPDPARLEMVVCAVVEAFLPGRVKLCLPPGEVSTASARLLAALDKQRKAAVLAALRAFLGQTRLCDGRVIASGLHTTCLRAGLLIAGDPGAALTGLDLLAGRNGPAGRRDDPAAADLLRFSVTDAHLGLRVRLGCPA